MYKITNSGCIIRLSDGASLPLNGANTDYAAYLAWIAAGNSPQAPDTPTLDQRKALKNFEINAARLAANFTIFPHLGKFFSCDQLSRSDIDGTNGTMTLTNAFPPNWPGGWKALDNTYIPITTRVEWEAFYLSMCAQGAANFAHSQALKAALDAATTPEQVAAIAW